jgi:hypothetical protein
MEPTLASAKAQNHHLALLPERVAVPAAWAAMLRGARQAGVAALMSRDNAG